MLPRKYNQSSSGVKETRPDIFIRTDLCHAHPPPKDAKSLDRPHVARCMTFFQSKADIETDPDRKVEYLAAAAEDRELLDVLKNKGKPSEEERSNQSEADSEQEDNPSKRQKI